MNECPETGQDRLSNREREVFAHMGEGLSNRQIADRLGITLHTTKAHVHNILTKLDAPTRHRAVAMTQGRAAR